MKFSLFVAFALIQVSFSQVVHQISFDRFSHYDPDDWITYAYSNHITSVDIGPENVYFGTTMGGILRYNFFDEQWLFPQTTSNGLNSNQIIRVVFDQQTNQLFALTNKGVNVFNMAFQYWQPTHSELPERKGPEVPKENNNDFRYPEYSRPAIAKWPNLFPNDNYELMLDGIIYNPDNEEYNVTDRVVDRWYKMWFGTNGTGVGSADLDMLQLNFIKQSIPAVRPRDLFIGDDGIWIGGSPFREKERGIVRWNYEDDSWDYFKSGINFNIFSDNINAIEGIDDQIFFGSEQGLIQYNTKKDTWISLQKTLPLKNDAIFDLWKKNKILYIASENGAFKYDYKTKQMENIGGPLLQHVTVTKIAGSSQMVFLATHRGIFEYDPHKDTLFLLQSRAAIADNFIDAVGVNKDTLWFAGQNGIGYYDISGDKWKSFPAASLRLNTKINDIAFADWNVWFATNRGLLKYDIERDYWYLYTKKDGLADNRVYNIDVDDDTLWLSTFGGVTQFRWYREGRFE
jgi:ligand-binding sensor domain-containing protein